MRNSLSTTPGAVVPAALPVSIQDDAFTLAYYLLGSESQAMEVVQQALARPFARARKPEELRLEILRGVGVQCQARSSRSVLLGKADSDDLASRLGSLSGLERSAAVLMDVLGLSYAEAARVLGCSPRQAGKLLAHARLNLIA